MTEGKDFKRLVRQRMAKTGESYTAARARFRPPPASEGAVGGLEAFRTMYVRTDLDRLAGHLEQRYGIRTRRLTELDLGVFRVDRHDGPAWVARVFPAARRYEDAVEDASILRFLEARQHVAERCAHDEPVSMLAGQPVLVTQSIWGSTAGADVSGPTLLALGDSLGRLHSLSGAEEATSREAGGWHHISVRGGGRRADVESLLPLLDEMAESVPPQDRDAFGFLCQQLREVDGCDSLPRTLIHPDPCGGNAIVSASGEPVLVDWTGAGVGARISSLGALIAGTLHGLPRTRPSHDMRRVDAIIAGYRRHVRLTTGEAARLAAAIAGGRIVLDCWCLLLRDETVARTAASIEAGLAVANRAAARAVEAFDLDEGALLGWFVDVPAAVDPRQGVLF